MNPFSDIALKYSPCKLRIIADVTLSDGNSLYTHLGNDWLGYLSLAGFIFFIIYPSIVEGRAKKRKVDPGLSRITKKQTPTSKLEFVFICLDSFGSTQSSHFVFMI